MFIEQPPWFFRALYPQAIFRMDPNERAVYLTFDDGPIPEVTPWVLELLKKHDIKATFFMVGDNIRKHPDEYRMVVEHGHRIGNHTFNHIRGFEYSNPDYLANTRRVDEIIHSDLFRPRSEEHTSELQSRLHLVCRLLLEKIVHVCVRANLLSVCS